MSQKAFMLVWTMECTGIFNLACSGQKTQHLGLLARAPRDKGDNTIKFRSRLNWRCRLTGRIYIPFRPKCLWPGLVSILLYSPVKLSNSNWRYVHILAVIFPMARVTGDKSVKPKSKKWRSRDDVMTALCVVGLIAIAKIACHAFS